MTARLNNLKQEVEKLYKSNLESADYWNFWGYPNHLLVVVKNAERIAKEKNADVEQVVAGALLHDIADAVMLRSEENHEKRSIGIARELLEKTKFSQKETDFIIYEIILPHSCKEILPTTLEGKVLATADSIAHFQSDFYTFFCWQHWGKNDDGNYYAFKKWVLSKIEKDFNRKIFFDDIREEVRPQYEATKLLFSL